MSENLENLKIRPESGREQEDKFVPTFDNAVEAYLNASVFGEINTNRYVNKGNGRFIEKSTPDTYEDEIIKFTITPDKAEGPLDTEGLPSYTVLNELANNAAEFAKSVIKTWQYLPEAAQFKDNLRILATAKKLMEYQEYEESQQ